jgi:preprotein translocase subunit SecE
MAAGDSLLPNRPLLQEMFASGVYKRNQGRLVRQFTCIAIWLVVIVAMWRAHTLFLGPKISVWLPSVGGWLSYLVAVAIGALGMWCGYRLVNWPKFADFLISVEAELNKVSWPTQRELVRASVVVIFTILFLSAILFLFDLVWVLIFSALGIN